MQPPDPQDIAIWRIVVRLGQFGVQFVEDFSKQITHIFVLFLTVLFLSINSQMMIERSRVAELPL